MQAIGSHWQLLVELVRKDFDARYAGSILGILWTQLYPLLLLAVYSFVFSVIFTNSIPQFPLFLFTGIALWNFFSTAIIGSTGSILANANLITKIGFPRELIVVSVILVAFVDLLMSHVILLAGAMWYGVYPTWAWLILPVVALVFALFCIGLGLILASAAVYLRDVRFFTEVAVLLLMFLSPVFYSDSSVPENFRVVVAVNPLATFISTYRKAMLEGVWPTAQIWLALLMPTIVAVWLGIEVFDRSQRGFPDAL
ncbi:MAG: ABC transporter permease [Acidobacteriaceae bacterium]|nr:ABC transporter permease [Acidobacteriaceae bacterium]